MNSPPARPFQDIRLSPADGKALLRERYDVRGADGRRICTVLRDSAAALIAAGTVELMQGPSGAYLRPTSLAYPLEPRHTHTETDSRSMLPGEPPKGAIRPHVQDIGRIATGQVGGCGRRSTGRSFRVRRAGSGHTAPAA